MPYLSERTKALMKERDSLKNRATAENNPDIEIELFKQYRNKRNQTKQSLQNDKKEYFDSKFNQDANSGQSSKKIWHTVRDTLKMTKNLAPTQLKVNDKIINDPQEMANQFAKIFLDKSK